MKKNKPDLVLRQVQNNPSLVSKLDDRGRTGLHYACMLDHAGITRILMDFGASLLVRESSILEGEKDGFMMPRGYSPIDHAFRKGGRSVQMINDRIETTPDFTELVKRYKSKIYGVFVQRQLTTVQEYIFKMRFKM